MTPDIAIEQLKEIQDWDEETAHRKADEILCNLLIDLGYQNVVDEYLKIDKWYA